MTESPFLIVADRHHCRARVDLVRVLSGHCQRLLLTLPIAASCGRLGYDALATDQDPQAPDAQVVVDAQPNTLDAAVSIDAGTQTLTVLDGSLLPQAQGFAVSDNIQLPSVIDVSTDGSAVEINTFGLPTGASGPYTMVYKDLGLSVSSGFVVEWSLRVLQADPHNSFDAGVTVMVSYTPGLGGPDERPQMIYFDEGEIGWGDETDSFAIDTTDAFHTYRLSVSPDGTGQLSVDGTPALTRTGWVTNNGILGFGDQTNDVGVDGNFQVKSISIPSSP